MAAMLVSYIHQCP